MADTATVTVACKLPNGIHLEAFNMVPMTERTMAGNTIETKRAVSAGRFTVKGVKRRSDDAGLALGFALTHGCPKDLWDSWLAANKDNPIVVNGIIFAAGGTNDVRAKAKDHEGIRSGFEPLNPKDLPREFKGKIETETRPAA